MPKVLTHFLEMAVSRRIFNRFPIFLLHAPRNELYFLLDQSHLKKMKNIMLKWRWKKFVTLEIRKSTGKILYHSIRKSILSTNMWLVYIAHQYFPRFWFFSAPDLTFSIFSSCDKFRQITGVMTLVKITHYACIPVQ